MSKRLLLVSLCFVVLLVAVGAYGYVEISSQNNHISDLESQIDSLQETVSSLESQVDELQDEIDHLQNQLSHMNSTKTFVFEWPPWEQNIVNGTLRIDLTFAWKGENLSVVAKINDDEYNEWDYLALAFDFEEADGIPDVGVNLYADGNMSSGRLSGNRIVSPFLCVPVPSYLHTCIFEPDVGYTFNASIPPPNEKPLTELPTDAVFVRFEDTASHGVYVYFRFGLPLEGNN